MKDKSDDVNVGIKSTALLFGENSRAILSAFSVSSLSLISYAGYLNGQGLPFYAGVGLAGLQLARVLRDTRWNDRGSCWQGFVRCGWVGVWVWVGASLDYVVLAFA